VNLKTIGLALVASAFMTSTAFAQAGTMQPIPNPPEKAKAHHKKHHHMAKKEAEGTAADKKEDKAEAKAAKPAATPPKK
jgi:hypothetical protein